MTPAEKQRIRDLWAWLTEWEMGHSWDGGPTKEDIKRGMNIKNERTLYGRLWYLGAFGMIECHPRGWRDLCINVLVPLLTDEVNARIMKL